MLLCVGLAGTASAQTSSGTLRLGWDPNTESNLAGYRVLFGTSPGVYTGNVDVGNVTIYRIHGLVPGQQYYLSVQAYNTQNQLSAAAAPVAGTAESTATLLTQANMLFGLGPKAGDGGWFSVRRGAEAAFAPHMWGRLPWPTYNATGGGVRLAAGDLDGDGADEIVVGLGPGSNGWVAILDDAAHDYDLLAWVQIPWPAYAAANGEVFPAIGDLDGDGRDEIVLGLGTGGQGWYLILNDAAASFAVIGWRQVSWPTYNTMTGVTHPAVGDLNGDGRAEIVLGLGQGSAGWLEVVNGSVEGYSHRNWIQISWPAYSAVRGTTFPAVGDLDGDGRAEVVIGLGRGSDGWFQILDDAQAGFAHVRWDRISWTAYSAHSGETHPAIGNVDNDARMEIVFGLAEYPGSGGWFEVFDDAGANFARRGWFNVGFSTFTTSGGALFPAITSRP